MSVNISSENSSTLDVRQMPGACHWCSTKDQATFHGGMCPRIRTIEYYPDGQVKHIALREEFG